MNAVRNSAKTKQQLLAEIAELREKLKKSEMDCTRAEEALRKAHDALVIRTGGRTDALTTEILVAEAISGWIYAFRVEPDGRSVWDWMTPGFTNMTGYRIEEFPNAADLDKLVHPEDRQIVEERLGSIKALRPHACEYRIVTKGGQICWVRDSVNPVSDPMHPGTIKVIGTAQNITEQKQAEKQLRESEERFRVAITNSPITVYQHDKELRFTWIYNPPPGFTAEKLLGKKIEEVHPPEEAAYLKKIKREVMETGVGTRGETWITVNGERRFVDFSIEPLFDGSGRMIGVTCATLDITKHKRTDEALRESEERFRGAAEGYPYGFGIYDDQRRYLFANPWTQRIAGLPLEQMVGKTDEEIFGPEVAGVLVPHLQRAYETGQMQSFEWAMPQERGGLVAIVNYVPLLDRAGRVRQVIKTIQDITAQKRAEEALQKARDELERRVLERTSELTETVEMLRAENAERKRLEGALRESEKQVRFFASQCLTAQEGERRRIAADLHDSIATSLAVLKFSIGQAVQQMEEGAAISETVKGLLPMLVEIIGEVRRIMADLRPAILDELGVISALNWFCREFEKTYSQIAIEIQIDISEEDILDSLKTSIYRVSQEAMTNIAKHSKASRVHLSLQKIENRIELTIQDNGQGFHLNCTAGGFGLSIMRERTELSGGRYTIESGEGKGTVIRASWPIPS
jgi:PAS domain S-box-containing protein